MPKFLTKREWWFSHICFVSGSVFTSLAAWFYSPGIALPLVGGIWLVSGGFCAIIAALFERLKRIEERAPKS